MTIQTVVARITSGPSKMDLMFSLFEAPHGQRMTVTFSVVPEGHPGGGVPKTYHTVRMSIESLEREDGSGENWNFAGYVKSVDGAPASSQGLSRGYFSTSIRAGHFSDIRWNW